MSQIAGYNKNITVLKSSTSADYTIPALRAPFGGATITGVWAVSSTTLAASTSDYFNITLLNGGTVGTATAAIGTVGGTTGWTAAAAQAFSLNTAADELTEGQYLMAKYDETGTVAVADVTVIVEWVHGKG
jgi:hypothetical protein